MGRGQPDSDRDTWAVGARLPLRRKEPGLDERIVRRVLIQFNLPTDGDPREFSASYRIFLPQAAKSGIRPLLRDAHRTASGEIDPGNPGEQIDWLAEQLHVPAPDGRLRWWQQTWNHALERSGLDQGPTELSAPARTILVRRLATEPPYPRLLVDALAEALKYEATSD